MTLPAKQLVMRAGSRAATYRPLVAAASLAVAGAGVAHGTWTACAAPPPQPLPTAGIAAPQPAAVAARSRSATLQRFLVLARRLAEILLRLLPVGLSHLVRSWLGEGSFRGETKPQFLSRLVAALAGLGPVGIKWGQWASTR